MKYLKTYENVFDYKLDYDVEKLMQSFLAIPGSIWDLRDPEVIDIAKRVQHEFDEGIGEIPKVYGIEVRFDEGNGLPVNTEMTQYDYIYEAHGETHARVLYATRFNDTAAVFDDEEYIITELNESEINRHVEYYQRKIEMFKNPIKF